MISARSSRRQVVYSHLNDVVLSMVELEISYITNSGKNQKYMFRKSLRLTRESLTSILC